MTSYTREFRDMTFEVDTEVTAGELVFDRYVTTVDDVRFEILDYGVMVGLFIGEADGPQEGHRFTNLVAAMTAVLIRTGR